MTAAASSVLFLSSGAVAAAVDATPTPFVVPPPENAQGAGWGRCNVLSVTVEAVTGGGVLTMTPVWDGAVDCWADYSSSPLVAAVSALELTLVQGDRRVLELRNPGGARALEFLLSATGTLSAVSVTVGGRS